MLNHSTMVSGSRALDTDLYQYTMGYAHWKQNQGKSKQGVFNLTYRNNPFKGGYGIATGLEHVIDFVEAFAPDQSDLDCLASLTGNDGKKLFGDEDYLHHLGTMKNNLNMDAVPEGTIVQPHEPIIRNTGNIIHGTIFETPSLVRMGFPTLIATKTARVKLSAKGEPVLEFGGRRAQGPDAALMASRAAYIGGADATANILAYKLWGIPCKGTHAHSWVMSYDDELESLYAYASAMPNNCVFLVDTYGTIEGIKKAIEVALWLRSKGFEVVGIRLDSGDLTYLSKAGRRMLTKAGFPKAHVFGSNDLDEYIIASLKTQGCKINIWGVGTKLITSYDQPSLGCVYKLAAWAEDEGLPWHYPIKLSEQAVKVSTPGIQQVRRFKKGGLFAGDMIFNEETPPPSNPTIIDPKDPTRSKSFRSSTSYEDLLVPIFRNGQLVYKRPPLKEIRERAQEQLAGLHAGVKRILNAHEYPVGLESQLHALKTNLIMEARARLVA